MKTKCKKCYYLTEDKKCSQNIIANIDNTVDYDQDSNPIVNNYKCLYAFPNLETQKKLDPNIDIKETENLRLSKIPKIYISLVIDCFANIESRNLMQVKDYINESNNHKNIIINDITILLSSEAKNKQKEIDFFEKENTFACKWKLCSLQISLSPVRRFMFGLENTKCDTVLYVSNDRYQDHKINNMYDKIADTTIVKQKPFIFLKKDANLVDRFNSLICSKTNLNTLIKNNISEEQSTLDDDYFTKLIEKGQVQDLILDVQ